MNTPIYERIFAVSVNDLDKYISESESRYYILKFDKTKNIYIIGETTNNGISQ